MGLEGMPGDSSLVRPVEEIGLRSVGIVIYSRAGQKQPGDESFDDCGGHQPATCEAASSPPVVSRARQLTLSDNRSLTKTRRKRGI